VLRPAAVIICALLAVSPAFSAEKAPEFKVKMGALPPEGTSWADVGHTAGKQMLAASGGRLKVVWYLGAVMGDEPDMVRKIHLGQLQGGVFTLLGLGKLVPETKVLELPCLFSDYDEVDYVLKRVTPAFVKIFNERGVVFLGWVEVGFGRIFSKNPVRNFEDMKQQKLWLWSGDPVQEEFFKLIGVTKGVPLQFQEVLPSLKTGMIDSFLNSFYGTAAFQWYTHVKYVNSMPIMYTPGAVVVDKKFYESMPEDLRNIFSETLRKNIPGLIPMIRRDEAKALEGLKKSGVEVIEPSQSEQAEMKATSRKLYGAFSDKYFPGWLMTEILTAVTEFNSVRGR
jgi:TRAP-type C4-dicarboxylate transport system substrate-binding protein